MNTQREYSYDLLRVIAIFQVMIVHVCSMEWEVLPVNSFDWQILNVYDSVARCSVPIFIMLSGAFLLEPSKDISIKKLFHKYILRLVIVIMVWGFSYQFMVLVVEKGSITFSVIIELLTNNLVSFGHTRLWFIYILLGLYLLIPILRSFIKGSKRKDIIYYLVFAFGTTFLFSFFQEFQWFTGLTSFLQNIGATSLVGYSGYFVLGYVLRCSKSSLKIRMIIYGLGILGLLATIIGTVIYSDFLGYANEAFYNYLSPNVVIYSVAIFVFVKNINVRNTKVRKTLSIITPTVFGIYLFHNLLNQLFIKVGIVPTIITPIISVPLIAVFWLIISFIVINIVRKIKIVGIYLT